MQKCMQIIIFSKMFIFIGFFRITISKKKVKNEKKNKHKMWESKQRFIYDSHMKQSPKYKLICLGKDKEKII